MSELWSVKQVAAYLGQSERQVWRYIDGGQIAAVRLSEKTVRVDKVAVDAFLASRPVREPRTKAA